MSTKSGRATVTHEDILIPVAYDGEGPRVPIQEPTVEVALKAFEWNKGYVGFKFAEAVRATLKLDDGREDTVEEERCSDTTYLFATKIINPDEFAVDYWPLKDKNTVLYDSERGLNLLEPHEQKDTVLVNKQGQQLFPPKNG